MRVLVFLAVVQMLRRVPRRTVLVALWELILHLQLLVLLLVWIGWLMAMAMAMAWSQ